MNPVHLGLLICYTFSLLAAAVISSRLWLFKKKSISWIFLIWTISISWWLICGLLEFLSATLKSKIFWMNMGYLGIVTFFVTWLLLCWCLTEGGKLITAGNILKISLFPAVILVMIWTNHIHHLVWPIIWIDTGSIPWLDFTIKGAGFWFYAIYCCGSLLAGILTLLNYVIARNPSNPKIYIIMLASAGVSWIIYLLLLFNSGEYTKIDPSPVAFIIAVIIYYKILSDNGFLTQTSLTKTGSKNN
jgi:hypothetical protein